MDGSAEGPKFADRTADHATTAVVSTLASLSTLKKDLYVVPESATSGEIIFMLSKGILPCIENGYMDFFVRYGF